MIKKIKEKLVSAKNWIKKNVKKVIYATAGVALAATGSILLIPESIPSIIAEGQIISFNYTDNNSNEDLIIYTDQKVYTPLWAWNGFDVYVAVKNKSGISQPISFQSFFSKNFIIEKADILDPTATTTIKVLVYGQVCEDITDTASTSNQCRQEKIGEEDKVVLGVWNPITQKEFIKTDYDRLISEKNIPVKQKTGDKIGGSFDDYSIKDQFSYYRLKIKSNEPFSKEEFDLEILGSESSYGLLDPTILTEDFNSYNDGDLNGQGSWSGSTNFDVQGTTVKEGAKAISVVATAGYTNVIKTGTLTADGKITFYFRTTASASEGIQFNLNEGAATGHYLIIDTGNIKYYNGASWITVGTYTTDTWTLVEIEWRSVDKKVNHRVDGGAWYGWDTPQFGWTTGLDKVILQVNRNLPGTNYYDYIAQDPYAPPSAAEPQFQSIIIE